MRHGAVAQANRAGRRRRRTRDGRRAEDAGAASQWQRPKVSTTLTDFGRPRRIGHFGCAVAQTTSFLIGVANVLSGVLKFHTVAAASISSVMSFA